MTITQQEIIALAVEAGAVFHGGGHLNFGTIDVDVIKLVKNAYQRGVRDERNACLAEIETGIWMDKTTEEVLAEIAEAIRARSAE